MSPSEKGPLPYSPKRRVVKPPLKRTNLKETKIQSSVSQESRPGNGVGQIMVLFLFNKMLEGCD